jgi:hypothetical protein
MSSVYSIKLVAKNEGLEYRDEGGTYYFDVLLEKSVWTVMLPCSKDNFDEDYFLTAEEKRRILPRIKEFLSEIRWLGFWKKKYLVRFFDQMD